MLFADALRTLLLAGSLVACPVAASFAFDGNDVSADPRTPLQIFKNPAAALRAGLEGVRSGDQRSAVEALKYAAAGGESLARWKLGRMYADGDGVPHDDIKAYDYFSQIVETYDEDNPNRREIAVVSAAFVAVGVYSLSGIPNTNMRPDPERAMDMFQYAATNFGDANAQYNLGRMYLDGNAVAPRDGRQAARWLMLAAEKGHAPAQALLGQLLFTGREGLQRQRARGLMWLTLARDAALASKKDDWIVDLYEKATAAASDGDRQIASAYLDDFLKKRN